MMACSCNSYCDYLFSSFLWSEWTSICLTDWTSTGLPIRVLRLSLEVDFLFLYPMQMKLVILLFLWHLNSPWNEGLFLAIINLARCSCMQLSFMGSLTVVANGSLYLLGFLRSWTISLVDSMPLWAPTACCLAFTSEVLLIETISQLAYLITCFELPTRSVCFWVGLFCCIFFIF